MSLPYSSAIGALFLIIVVVFPSIWWEAQQKETLEQELELPLLTMPDFPLTTTGATV